MKNLSISLLIVLCMSSCSVFKKRTVDLHTKQIDTTTHVDSSTVSKIETVDKSQTVITEKAKGIVYTKPQETSVRADLNDLLSGLKTVQDSGLFKITQSYDSVKHQINTLVQVKPQAIDYDIYKTTYTSNDIKSNSESKSQLKKDTKSSLSEKDKHTESTPTKEIWIFAALVIAGFIIYLFITKKAGA